MRVILKNKDTYWHIDDTDGRPFHKIWREKEQSWKREWLLAGVDWQLLMTWAWPTQLMATNTHFKSKQELLAQIWEEAS